MSLVFEKIANYNNFTDQIFNIQTITDLKPDSTSRDLYDRFFEWHKNPDAKTSESEFLVKKVRSLEGVWFKLSVTLQSTSYQTPSLQTHNILTKNSPTGL